MTHEEREHIKAERNRILRERLNVIYYDERDGVWRTRRGATGPRRPRVEETVDRPAPEHTASLRGRALARLNEDRLPQ